MGNSSFSRVAKKSCAFATAMVALLLTWHLLSRWILCNCQNWVYPEGSYIRTKAAPKSTFANPSASSYGSDDWFYDWFMAHMLGLLLIAACLIMLTGLATVFDRWLPRWIEDFRCLFIPQVPALSMICVTAALLATVALIVSTIT